MLGRSAITTYIVLVGLPLVLMLGVLKLGEKLEAPPSISGEWVIEQASAVPDACADEAKAVWNRTLSVSQSGQYLNASLPGRGKYEGFLSGQSVAFHGSEEWQATVAGGKATPMLVGKISIPSKPECGSMSFRANRAATRRN